MKRKKSVLWILVVCIICMCSFSVSAAKAKTGWVKKGKTYYYVVKGKKVKNCVKKIKQQYYYFDKKGKRKTGWRTYKKGKYYFDQKTGAAYIGVKKVGKDLYAFDNKGKLIKKKGLYTINGKKYYVNKNGKLLVGWQCINGVNKYFLPLEGHLASGEVCIGKNVYLFDSEGELFSGEQIKKDQKSFYSKGVLLVSRFVKSSDGTYYVNEKGKVVTGFRTINGGKYYFGNTGRMQTGLTYIGNNIYFFNADGKMLKNSFVTVGGNRYYLGTNGCAKKNCWYEGCFFDNKGRVVNDAVSYNDHSIGQVTEQMLKNLKIDNCSKLMVVAHPDDETLWGGAHLTEGGFFVVCLTNSYTSVRVKEFHNVMKETGNIGLVLGYPDLIDAEKFIRSMWTEERHQIVKDLNTILNYKHWGMVVTHNPDGEYGHIHHKLTSKLVTESYYYNTWSPNLFYFGKYYSKDQLEQNMEYIEQLPEAIAMKKKQLLNLYPSQPNSMKLYGHAYITEKWIRAIDWK